MLNLDLVKSFKACWYCFYVFCPTQLHIILTCYAYAYEIFYMICICILNVSGDLHMYMKHLYYLYMYMTCFKQFTGCMIILILEARFTC